MADYLIVAVNTDASVQRLKGRDRPFDTLSVRMERVARHLSGRGLFTYAVVPFDGTERPLIVQMRPDVVYKGADHSPNVDFIPLVMPSEVETTRFLPRVPVIHIPRLPGISTTLLARRKE